MPISGTASLIALVARHMRLSGFSASFPSALRFSGGVLGKRARQGMPASRASLARATIRSTDQRDTPGRLDTGRSEEHTSELQSLMRISYAVFCLKKKIQNKKYKQTYYK